MSDPAWFRKGHDTEYSQWRSAHMQDGHILNKDGAKWKLHTPSCLLIFDIPLRRGQSLTTYTKICSTSIAKLQTEARTHSATILTDCTCQL